MDNSFFQQKNIPWLWIRIAKRGIKFMTDCAYCQKRILLKFIMCIYNIKATDIAKEIHVSDSLVRKLIDGVRTCQTVDYYFIQKCFGLSSECFNG